MECAGLVSNCDDAISTSFFHKQQRYPSYMRELDWGSALVDHEAAHKRRTWGRAWRRRRSSVWCAIVTGKHIIITVQVTIRPQPIKSCSPLRVVMAMNRLLLSSSSDSVSRQMELRSLLYAYFIGVDVGMLSRVERRTGDGIYIDIGIHE